MVKISVVQVFILLVFVDITTSLLLNETIKNVGNRLKSVKTRRQGRKDRSTSSSGSREKAAANEATSLGLSSDGITSSDNSDQVKMQNKYRPRSTAERHGWRKWHRKCTPCPDDQVKKWRDPSIKWICGAFQRARRSFKSICMMHYRNCQDGTMFTKVGDHRCTDGTAHGEHFFYEYHVVLSEETAPTDDETDVAKDSDSS